VAQWHKHPSRTALFRAHVIFDDGVAVFEPACVEKAFKDAIGFATLLARVHLVLRRTLINLIKFGSLDQQCSLISRRLVSKTPLGVEPKLFIPLARSGSRDQAVAIGSTSQIGPTPCASRWSSMNTAITSTGDRVLRSRNMRGPCAISYSRPTGAYRYGRDRLSTRAMLPLNVQNQTYRTFAHFGGICSLSCSGLSLRQTRHGSVSATSGTFGIMRYQLVQRTVTVIVEEGGSSLRLTRLQRVRKHSRRVFMAQKACRV
jgi:hypothetical protein